MQGVTCSDLARVDPKTFGFLTDNVKLSERLQIHGKYTIHGKLQIHGRHIWRETLIITWITIVELINLELIYFNNLDNL